MKGLIQRVSSASVTIDQMIHGEIEQGILLLLGIEKHDDIALVTKMLKKVLAYRIFSDEDGHMNLSLNDIKGELLIVSQFTLAADTKKGLRPSFSASAPPAMAEPMYDEFVKQAKEHCAVVATGQFGADMKVQLLNDGPVTFLLEM